MTRKSLFDVVGQLPVLRRYARSLTRDEIAAEDLVQDTLVRAYGKRASFRPGQNLRVWLMAILHNCFIDGTRERKLRLPAFDPALGIEPSVDPGQDHTVRLRQLSAAFDRLPAEQRAALHLVAVEGLAYGDAATALEIPLGTLMSRLGRARAALRQFEQDAPATASSRRTAYLRVVGGTDEPID